MIHKSGLREAKKEATIHALAEAAFELALEKGLDGFVVDDVVQRAGYSRRTFANHFSCKEEAIVMAAITIKNGDEAEFNTLYMSEHATPLDALQQWMKLQLTAGILRKIRELISLSKRHSTLEPYILSMLHQLQKEAQHMLSAQFQGRYPEEYSHILLGAVYGSVLPIVDGSIKVLLPGDPADETNHPPTFEQYLDTTFRYLRDGF